MKKLTGRIMYPILTKKAKGTPEEMIKKIFLFFGLASILFGMSIFHCKTMDMNVLARKNLADCKYEVEKIVPTKVYMRGIKLEAVSFDVHLKITNTSKNDVALDRVEADVLLDEKKITNFQHTKFIRIPPSKSATEIITVKIPFAEILSLSHNRPEKIGVDARLYVNIMIGKFTLKSPFVVNVKKSYPIPYDKIEKKVQEQIESLDINNLKKKGLKLF